MADKSIIGAELGTTTFPVERGKIREFAQAVQAEYPEYLEDPQPEAPPTFVMTVAHWPRQSEKPPPDMGLDFRRVLHAEQEFAYVKPVKAGDTLTGTARISDVYTKEGKRGGTMTFVVFETRYKNQDGEDCVIARQVVVETAKAAT